MVKAVLALAVWFFGSVTLASAYVPVMYDVYSAMNCNDYIEDSGAIGNIVCNSAVYGSGAIRLGDNGTVTGDVCQTGQNGALVGNPNIAGTAVKFYGDNAGVQKLDIAGFRTPFNLQYVTNAVIDKVNVDDSWVSQALYAYRSSVSISNSCIPRLYVVSGSHVVIHNMTCPYTYYKDTSSTIIEEQ